MKKLNGDWDFIIDPQSEFDTNYINDLVANSQYSGSMKVPSNWEKEGLVNYSGTVWFVKKFSLTDTELKSNLKVLTFDGVDYFTDIWINNSFAGSHEGYFQRFYADLSNECTKNNLLIVKVTSPKESPGDIWPYKKELIKGVLNHHDCRPGGWNLNNGQNGNTGGIWNNVYLQFADSFFIENIKLTPSIKGKRITVKISLFAQEKSSDIAYSIKTPDNKIISGKFTKKFQVGFNETEFDIKIPDAQIWWPWELGRQPLYSIKFDIEGHTNNAKFGFREIEFNQSGQFTINGLRLFLRGTNIIPEQYLSTLSGERIRRMVKLIKNANINIVRVHAHITRNEFYDECDKQGILIWQDFPLQWTYSDSENFMTNAKAQIFNMVNQFYNHPSISFWCCQNEPGEQIETLSKELYNVVSKEDKTRIIRVASNYEEHPYDGWYWGSYEHFAAVPMGPLVTEFGAQAIPEVSSLKKFLPANSIYPPEWEKWTYHNFQYDQTFLVAGIDKGKSINEFVENSQQYQSDLIKTAVDFYRREKQQKIDGIFQFMFIDCWPSITWSVVDYFENPKKGYYALKNAFQPVYVSLRIRQKKYFATGNLQIDIWVINDLHKEFNNCKVQFFIKEKQFAEISLGKLDADSVRFISYEAIKISLKDFTLGLHTLALKLISNKKEISTNSYEIEMVKNV